jgi:SAM-dependent methyltransferase
MDLQGVQENWNEFGRRDPLWAILTDPRLKGNRWDPVEFFRTGRQGVAAVLEILDSLRLRFSRWRALDFGCGVGRLTQALCSHFHFCCGIDIAESMIALANQYNQYPARCRYFVNAADNLRLFEDDSFDFVLTLIVLQHMQPRYSKQFIREFVRVLAPGGVLVFQIPSEPANLASSLGSLTPGMSETGYRAAIRVEHPLTFVEAGRPFDVVARVRNTSTLIWPATGAADGTHFVQLGNHWVRSNGDLFAYDDGRAMLPRDLAPGEEVELKLSVNAPNVPGPYTLELDMVEEGVTWFKENGSPTHSIHVQVTGAVPLSRPAKSPVMEMHGVPKSEVQEVIAASGGRILQVRDDNSAGGWNSYLYIVTKP